jgi:hypothetical protein
MLIYVDFFFVINLFLGTKKSPTGVPVGLYKYKNATP